MSKTEFYKPFLTIFIDEPDPLLSPKSTLCSIDGCFRTILYSSDTLCDEHQVFTSLEYITSHKPVQSPVATSKYSTDQRGLSCIQMHTD
jgi:hypothetical protein